MSWTDDVTFDIELPNGEVWRITYDRVANLIAKAKYEYGNDKFWKERSYYVQNPGEAVYDLQGAVDWPEIREDAEQIEQADDVDYQEQWMGADVEISKDMREGRDET